MPQISVLMGVYSQNKDTSQLAMAVDSVLKQTFQDFEFLICDDGSTDEVKSFLNECARQDPRIRLIRTGDKYTLPAKLNECIRHAEGKYLARMDDDDCSGSFRFQRQLEYLEAHPRIAFVGSNVIRVYEGDQAQKKQTFPEYPSVRDFLFVMPYIHPALMFRKESIEAVEGYSEAPECILCEDYDLLLRMYIAGMQGANLQEFLFYYSMSGVEKKRRSFRARMNEVRVRYRHFKKLGLMPGALVYVVKPLLLWCMPIKLVNRLRMRRIDRTREE